MKKATMPNNPHTAMKMFVDAIVVDAVTVTDGVDGGVAVVSLAAGVVLAVEEVDMKIFGGFGK